MSTTSYRVTAGHRKAACFQALAQSQLRPNTRPSPINKKHLVPLAFLARHIKRILLLPQPPRFAAFRAAWFDRRIRFTRLAEEEIGIAIANLQIRAAALATDVAV